MSTQIEQFCGSNKMEWIIIGIFNSFCVFNVFLKSHRPSRLCGATVGQGGPTADPQPSHRTWASKRIRPKNCNQEVWLALTCAASCPTRSSAEPRASNWKSDSQDDSCIEAAKSNRARRNPGPELGTKIPFLTPFLTSWGRHPSLPLVKKSRRVVLPGYHER